MRILQKYSNLHQININLYYYKNKHLKYIKYKNNHNNNFFFFLIELKIIYLK